MTKSLSVNEGTLSRTGGLYESAFKSRARSISSSSLSPSCSSRCMRMRRNLRSLRKTYSKMGPKDPRKMILDPTYVHMAHSVTGAAAMRK